ncbi:MAG: hypothetical protein MUP85_08255 [Candidatus Lokiarchaeota archaeon]|nr:hypothetical protein [Candidatus Lokiarchaeota archaeon]
MTTDIFYATLKLVSGEEIISKVCAFIENGEVLVVLDNPINVNIINVPNIKVPLIKVEPWITLTESETHIINRKNIITMNEIKDTSLIRIHQKYIQGKDSNTRQTSITPDMGYISKIEDARKLLENLYESQDSHSKFE